MPDREWRSVCAQLVAEASTDVRPRQLLRDYTWPQRVPLDQLQRMVARELQEAAELARIHFPTWK